jgi:hypothetical protein
MTLWRLDHPLKGVARKRANARSYTNVYIRRGKLIPGPCKYCGATLTQAHHLDYDQPLLVEWLCRGHHLAAHGRTAR